VFFFDQTIGLVSGTIFDGRGALARTTDGGLNWSTAIYDQAIEGIAFPTTASGFAVGADGRILHSTDSGTTWTDQTSGTSANLTDVSFASDALTGIAVGDPVTGVMTPIGPLETIISDVVFSSDGTLYASSPTGDLYSIDPVTGVKTLLFNTGIDRLSGLAAAPKIRPTPTPRPRPTPHPRPTP
jgi:outer membrane protein assembly factor BamB